MLISKDSLIRDERDARFKCLLNSLIGILLGPHDFPFLRDRISIDTSLGAQGEMKKDSKLELDK